MPHQCVVCNKFYEDGSQEILKGCPCGGKLFFYIKKSVIDNSKESVPQIKLEDSDKQQIEEDVRDLMGIEDDNTPVVLDIEAVRVVKPGKYELDIMHLFRKEPLIFRLEEGKYMVDLVQSFKNLRGKK